MDSIGSFIRDQCVVEDIASVPVSELYGVYEQWAKDGGEKPLAKRFLSQRLHDRGFTTTRTGIRNVSTLNGIRLILSSEMRTTDNIVNYRRHG
jgi:phage/plasmid-associated DNA primase